MKRSDFLAALFPSDMLLPGESALVSYPTTYTDNGREVKYYRQAYWSQRSRGVDTHNEGWLYGVSTVKKGAKARRRSIDLMNAFVLVLDDIKTKAVASPVAPSYIMETSPENYQHGFLLHPFCVTPESGGAEYFDGVLLGAAAKGYNDEGCRSASRVVKLPGAIHHTGFITKLIEWHPERVWALPDLVTEMGIEVVKVPRRTYTAVDTNIQSPEDIADSTYRWLSQHDMVHGMGPSGFVAIRCPWADGHTNPDDFLAGYSPEGYGLEGRGFKCFHSHCLHRSAIDLVQWVFSQGGAGLSR